MDIDVDVDWDVEGNLDWEIDREVDIKSDVGIDVDWDLGGDIGLGLDKEIDVGVVTDLDWGLYTSINKTTWNIERAYFFPVLKHRLCMKYRYYFLNVGYLNVHMHSHACKRFWFILKKQYQIKNYI